MPISKIKFLVTMTHLETHCKIEDWEGNHQNIETIIEHNTHILSTKNVSFVIPFAMQMI